MKDPPPTVGFITPARTFDPAPAEFATVCATPVRTQQAPLPLPEFEYRLENIARTEPELTLCARVLSSCGCDLVAQVGTPFGFAGSASEEEARSRCRRLAAAAGKPVLMTALALVDALRALDAKRVALACTYYDAEWKADWSRFVAACGFEVRHAATLVDQGLVGPGATMEDYGWTMTPELARASIHRAAADAPAAEAIVVTGTGTRTLALMKDLEAETDRPVVGADAALYWAILETLGLIPARAFGRLFARLHRYRKHSRLIR